VRGASVPGSAWDRTVTRLRLARELLLNFDDRLLLQLGHEKVGFAFGDLVLNLLLDFLGELLVKWLDAGVGSLDEADTWKPVGISMGAGATSPSRI